MKRRARCFGLEPCLKVRPASAPIVLWESIVRVVNGDDEANCGNVARPLVRQACFQPVVNAGLSVSLILKKTRAALADRTAKFAGAPC